MKTLINITETGLKIEMGTMNITIETPEDNTHVVEKVLESATIPEPEKPITKPGKKKVKPAKTNKKNSSTQNRIAKEKSCKNCEGKFQPTTNAQKFCTIECKKEFKHKELDKTLADIEKNRREPYKLQK